MEHPRYRGGGKKGADEELAPNRRDRYGTAMLHSAVLNVMIKAARRAGRSLKRDLGEIEHLQVSLKGPRNFVTAADRRAEQIVYEELAKARPAYGFLGEEGGARAGTDTSHRWIVDPLDGTTNFLHGIPHFAVSIALERDGAVVAGLTYNPANEELFIAERGKGAFLNDQRIRVAARERLADAIVACGLPHYGRGGDLALARNEIAAAQQSFAGLRRYGAATLDLAWIAAGRLDAYWERDLSPWDLAAGMILVREAGGFVSDCDGKDAVLTKGQVVAGNDTMHRELLRLLKAASKEASKEAGQETSKEAVAP
jgi:myo-inositol-1(or 4)-monophosphatase